jgi:hypothetical protein
MKHTLSLLLVAPLALWSVSCKKADAPKPAPAPAAAAVPASAPPGVPGVPGAPAVAKPMPPQMPDVLARVNGEKIERWEFDNAVKRMEARAGGPVPPEKRDEVPRRPRSAGGVSPARQRIPRAQIVVPDADVDARLVEIRSFPTEEAFKKRHQRARPDARSVEGAGQSSLGRRVIQAEVNSKVAVQDPEVKTFYDSNLERFKRGDSVHAARPDWAAAEPGARERQGAQQGGGGAQDGQGRRRFLRHGAGQLVGFRGRANGGDLGFFPKGADDAGVRGSGVQAEPGTTSALVEPFGFHIIKVLERRGRARRSPGVGARSRFPDQGQREQARAVRGAGEGKGDRDTRLKLEVRSLNWN